MPAETTGRTPAYGIAQIRFVAMHFCLFRSG
jgi:hypothetical protein